MTLYCVNGGSFNENGPEPDKPLTSTMLTFLACVLAEARNSELIEGDVQSDIRTLVEPNVQKALLRESLNTGSKVSS